MTSSFFENIFSSLRKVHFTKIESKPLKDALVFRDADYEKLIFVQNKCVIRNQHRKLHRITYILSKNIFLQNSTVLPLSCFFTEFYPVVPHRSNFDEKYFLI